MPDRPTPSALDQLDGLLREPAHPPAVRLPAAGLPAPPRRPDPQARTMPWAILAVAAVLCVTIGVLLSRMLAAAPAPVVEAPPVETAQPVAQEVATEPVIACAAIEWNGQDWLVGPDRDTDYAGAQAWAASAPDCGGGWRMPGPAELVGLFDRSLTAGTGHVERGRAWPAHIDPAFSAIGGGSWVWSRGSASSGSAPAVNLNQGVTVRLPPDGGGLSVRAFAVRDRG